MTRKGSARQVLDPSAFRTFLGQRHPAFASDRQADVMECLGYLLESVDSEARFFDSDLASAFKGELYSTMQCHKCKAFSSPVKETF